MATGPKNKRLSDANRATLLRFAKKQITETQDSAAFDAAYDAAATAIASAVERAYPSKDMKVLARYDMASPDACIYVSDGGFGDYDQFCFRDGDKRIPTRPDRYCRRQPILIEGSEADFWRAYNVAKADYDGAIERRYADFKALVWNTASFNGLAEVWPAVEALREEIVGSGAALSTLSDDVVARIKADPALVPA